MVISVLSGTLEGTWVAYHLVIVASAPVDCLGHSVEHFVSVHGGMCFLGVGTNI